MNTNLRTSLIRILDFRVLVVSLIATLSTFSIFILIAMLATNLADRELQDEAFLAANTIDLFFMDLESQLVTMSDLILYTDDSNAVIRTVMDGQPAIFSLLYSDAEGNVISQRQRVGQDVIEQIEISNILAMMGEQNILWMDISSEEFGVPFTTVQVVVKDNAGSVAGILSVEIDLTALWNTITSVQIGESGYAYLVEDSGTLLAYRDITLLQNNSQIEDIIGVEVEELKQDQSIIPNIHQGINQQWVVSQTQSLQTRQWITVVEKPLGAVLTPLGIFFAIPIIFLVVVVIVVIDTNRFITRRVGTPLKQMREGVEYFKNGDVTAAYPLFQQSTNDEIGILAQTVTGMMKQINSLLSNLEQRVEERTRDLSVASDVSRQITTELDLQNLLKRVATLSKESFQLYHVSIFLYDNHSLKIHLAQGTGDIGQKMLEQGKYFDLNATGLVPEAARTKQYQLANDVYEDSRQLKNNMLPETKSELAIPMLYRNQLVGIIDLQSNEKKHFRDDEISILVTLSEQIAIAITNAQLFSEIELAREQAVTANKVKSTFLASMSHELRTPLNAIINFTRFVAKGTMGDVNDKQKSMLGDVIISSEHLLNLINDVLDMSKIESGALVLFVTDDVSIIEIVDHVSSVGRSLLIDKDVVLKIDIAPDLPAVRGDKQRITQIMLNVVSNACKFTEDGSIMIHIQQEEKDLIISISDSGLGISEENFEDVFERFKQTETGLRQGDGTGLGMPITKSLVELHDGKIWIESIVGQGTTFFIRLPIKSDLLVPTITN